jgi:hypothetical protein
VTLRLSVVFACAVACACSGGGGQPDGGDDAGAEAEAAAIPYPAPHAPMPKAVNSGGSVIAAPKLVTISFQNDPLQSAIDAFSSQLASSPNYWKGAVSEYGVGPVTQVVYHAAETPPANLADSDVQAWLTNKIQTDNTFPQPDASTIYTLYYPSGTNVTMGSGITCGQFQGYHDSYALSTDGGSVNVIYAIVPRCPPPPVQGVTDADQMTAEASHELVEAATDPLPSSKPAYITVDPDSHAWELLAGGEVGDLCGAFPDSFYKPTGFDHLVQRVWSNANAAAGHDPCEPDGTTPYFNAAPLVNDTITIQVGGVPTKTKGIKVPIGQSVDVELDLYSDAPTSGPWKVTVMDITSAFFGGKPALSFVLDKNTGQNGDKITMTVTLLRNVIGGAPFWIQSDLGTSSTVWLGAVNYF